PALRNVVLQASLSAGRDVDRICARRPPHGTGARIDRLGTTHRAAQGAHRTPRSHSPDIEDRRVSSDNGAPLEAGCRTKRAGGGDVQGGRRLRAGTRLRQRVAASLRSQAGAAAGVSLFSVKRVFGSYNQQLVHHAKNLLEAAGIRVLVRNQYLSSAMGELPPAECEAQ